MNGFAIKEINEDLEIISYHYDVKGFIYHIHHHNVLNVKEINIVNPYIISSLVLSSFDKKYKKLIENYLSFLQEDDDETSEGHLMQALDEIARLRNILIQKYHYYLKKELETKMLKKLKILENEIRSKIVDIKLIKEQQQVLENEPERGKGR